MSSFATAAFWRKNKTVLLIALLAVFYTVGILGLLAESTRRQFLGLSFMNLVISFVVLILSRKTKLFQFLLYLMLCFIVGMAVEWIGIHTGWLFGDYAYGNNLGAKWQGVPWIIGINWGVLSVCTCSVAYYIQLKPFQKAICSAALMTLLDFFIEPVAVASDYWHWNTPEIPVFNYICWFVIAVPLHWIYFKSKLAEQNKVAVGLCCMLLVFFLVLNFR